MFIIQAIAILLIRLDLLVLFLFEIIADASLGAVVMGMGVLLGVLTMITGWGPIEASRSSEPPPKGSS